MKKVLVIVFVVLAYVVLVGVGLAAVVNEDSSVPSLGYGSVSGSHIESVSFCNPRIDPSCDK